MKPTSPPIAEATPRSRSGAGPDWDRRASRLYTELRPRAFAMVRRAFGSTLGEQELEDVYSGAWLGTLRLLARRHQRMSDEEIRKYLFAAVANQAAKELRRRRRKPTAPLELGKVVAEQADTPLERAEGTEDSRVTRDLLLSLPPRRRAVMLLRYGCGLEPAQVCEILDGLSARAYRKEITRGVDELTERMRRFRAGDWCGEREPVLKALAAGVAGEEEERQARAHLAHCRACSGFVARLSGHLHDLGGAVLAPGAIDGIDGELWLDDRAAGVLERARDAIGGVLGRGGQATQELATSPLATGGTRGAGVAGAGVIAKLAGLGTAGKVAVACLGTGAAATACVAAGVAPFTALRSAPERGEARLSVEQSAERRPEAVAPAGPLPSQLADGDFGAEATPAAAGGGDGGAPGAEGDASNAPAAAEPVLEPTTPPSEQEFGVPAAASASGPAPGAAPGGGSGAGEGSSAAQQEFGP